MSSSISKHKYIDVHGHLNFAAFDADRDVVIERARNAGVAMIAVGTQAETSKKALELAEAHADVYAAIGLHPIHTTASYHDIQELGIGGKEFTSRGEQFDIVAYREMAGHPKVVAIGECGLDYYRLDEQSVTKQRDIFASMIDLANEINKPLMLHIRNGSGVSAYNEAYALLKERSKVRGNLHFFAGSVDEAKPFLDLGYMFSFTGVITFARSYDEVIKYIPLDRIMSETDCPYVAPEPYRGERNEPSHVVEVVKALAAIKGIKEDDMAQEIMKNAEKFFSLS